MEEKIDEKENLTKARRTTANDQGCYMVTTLIDTLA